jgi:hypothetical protein
LRLPQSFFSLSHSCQPESIIGFERPGWGGLVNDEEADRLYTRLLRMLGDRQLRWVAEQVSEEVALGRTFSKTVPVLDSQESPEGSRPRRRKTKFVSTVQYTPKERLSLLLDAIDRAVVVTSEFQKHILAIGGTELHVLKATFLSDDRDGPTHFFDVQGVNERMNAASILRDLIKQFKVEVENAR